MGTWRHRADGIPSPDLFGGEHHRYPFETDAEGFRNPVVREQMTGKKVQNYGTSSFGSQQELYVLEDYVVRHRPRGVVLGYFAGNDLFDAERFDSWEHGADKPGEEATGWRLKKIYRRYETLYLAALARVALPPRPQGMRSPGTPRDSFARAYFDRGAYAIPTAFGIPLRFAFMPPYLQKLASPRAEIERSHGWELVRATLLKMNETCAQHESRLTILFIPSKDEVYWPLVERSLGRDDLQRSLDFVSSYNHMPLRVADIRENRLAQNEVMRDFCAAAGIHFFDLTPALEQAAGSGRPVYFADDAHWNAAGHEIAAQELAKFLAQ